MTSKYDSVHMPHKAQLRRYQRSIRNVEKQRYADDYIDWWLLGGYEPDTAEYECSYMAKQAVRMMVRTIAPRPREGNE